MGFWSGFEGLTGHRPGAFKGFSFKDILDDDLWKRKQRIRQQPGWDEGLGRYAKVGEPLFNDRTGEKMMTNWYKGRGRPELMNPRVGGGVADQPRQPAFSSPMRPEGAISGPRLAQESPRVDKTFPPYAEQHAAIMRNRYPGGQTTVSAARPWPNIQAQMLSDPRQGAHGQADRTTTIKKFADPNKSDEETTVIKDKIQGGPAYNRPPPNWMMRTGLAGEGYFGRPTTFSSPTRPEGALASSAQPTSIMNMFNMQAWQDLARRKWEERMRAKRGY